MKNLFLFSRFFCLYFILALERLGCLLDVDDDVIPLRLMNNHGERHVVQRSDQRIQHELLLKCVGVHVDGSVGLVRAQLVNLDLSQRVKEPNNAQRTRTHGVAEDTRHELLGERHLGIRPKVKGLG